MAARCAASCDPAKRQFSRPMLCKALHNIGRKAFLFAGSHQAAEMTAAMYSFMATCKKNGVDEQRWLTDVFERIQSHKHKDLYQLLPNNWEKFRNLEN